MVAAAPRIHPALVAAVGRIDRPGRPIAETHRRVGEIADTIGETRPSYEQLRWLVHAHREERLAPNAGLVLLQILLSPTPLRTYHRLLDD